MSSRSLVAGASRLAARALSSSSSSSSSSSTAAAAPAAAAAAFPPPLFVTDAATRRVLSPWHDVPLRPRGAPANELNFVLEIPRGATPPKLEIDPGRPFNAIAQDKNKDGTPRRYRLDTLIHYGALPQTWEDPAHKDRWTGLLGDGDPVDVCDIAVERSPAPRPGACYRVKVLGALAMIDGGETDWKILAVRADDPLARAVDDVTDAARTPAAVLRLADAVREWFRLYKVPEGKGENSFAFEGRWLSAATALEVVASTEQQYAKLLAAPRLAAPAKGAPWLPPQTWRAPDAGFLSAGGAGADLLTGTTTVAP